MMDLIESDHDMNQNNGVCITDTDCNLGCLSVECCELVLGMRASGLDENQPDSV